MDVFFRQKWLDQRLASPELNESVSINYKILGEVIHQDIILLGPICSFIECLICLNSLIYAHHRHAVKK